MRNSSEGRSAAPTAASVAGSDLDPGGRFEQRVCPVKLTAIAGFTVPAMDRRGRQLWNRCDAMRPRWNTGSAACVYRVHGPGSAAHIPPPTWAIRSSGSGVDGPGDC